jgi:competence protein ComEC
LPWIVLSLAFLSIAGQAALSAPSGLTFTFIDVGEGDSTLVQTPSGYSLLVDTGSPLSQKTVIDTLTHAGVRALSALIVTHPHLDHAGGVFSVLDAFPTLLLADSGQSVDKEAVDNDMYRWYQKRVRSHAAYRTLRAPESWRVDDAIFTVMWPLAGELNADWNNNSIVVRIDYGAFHALLMGDALKDTADALVPRLAAGRISLLKAGHHSSRFSESASFIDAVNPEVVVVSVDAGNIRGYPDAGTVEKYRAHGRVYRTDVVGTVQVKASADGTFAVSTQRAR